jgi:hypothetical protein
MAPELDGMGDGAAPGGGVIDDTIILIGTPPAPPDAPGVTQRIFTGFMHKYAP